MRDKLYPHVCENPECGKQFFGRKDAKFCSVECNGRLKSLRSVESLRKRSRREREEMRQRLAQRDALYAAHAAPVKVEERGGVRIETRGQFCIAPRITHFGRN